MRFTQRVDWRVSYLGKLLAEVVVNNARLIGEYGEWGIIVYRIDRFLIVFVQYANYGVQFFRVVVKLFLVVGKRVVVQFAVIYFFIGQIFKRYQSADVFFYLFFIWMAVFQIVIGFCRVQNTFIAGVDNYQFVWFDAVFFDYFVRLVILDIDFRGVGDEFIFGDDVARRTQIVTVEVIGGKTIVGYYDVRRVILRFYMYGVKVKEGTQFRVYIRVVLLGGWY